MLAHGTSQVTLDHSPAFRERIDSSARRFARRLAAGEKIYGVTTGFGESCLNSVTEQYFNDLSLNLVQFHGCGTGALLRDEESAAVLAACLASLTGGWSAVRPVLLERLCDLPINDPAVHSQSRFGRGQRRPDAFVLRCCGLARRARSQLSRTPYGGGGSPAPGRSQADRTQT